MPADKQLYALRDVTATVDILPLIASSIMSKKIAGGADAIVLDVKVGDGAFMKTLDDARALAETMLELGRHAGREVVCLLTDMDQPLGAAVGNALEIVEARDTVRGEGPPDFTELVLDACARLLVALRPRRRRRGGPARAEAAVADGSALDGLRALDPGAGRRPRPGRAAAGAGRAPVSAPRTGSSRDSARSRSASRPCTSAPDAARRRTRSTTRSASSADAKRGDGSREASVLAEVHARDEAAAGEAVAASWRPTSWRRGADERPFCSRC